MGLAERILQDKIQVIEFDYNKIYDYKYYVQGQLHGLDSWNKRTIKFGDNLAALCYALHIEWDTLVKNFPIVFQKNEYGDTADHPYTVEDIAAFFNKNIQYRSTILEVGGGRGELSNLMTHLNIDHTSVEVCLDADRLYRETGAHFFGQNHTHKSPIIGPIEKLLQDNKIHLNRFDAIIFPESAEHIPTENFNYVLDRIVAEFKGRFIVTNWKYYHPIIGSLDNPGHPHTMEEHVADINDEVYARWARRAKKLIYKDRSHLVLQF